MELRALSERRDILIDKFREQTDALSAQEMALMGAYTMIGYHVAPKSKTSNQLFSANGAASHDAAARV
eukprot:3281085-Rhodomonas_salina.1